MSLKVLITICFSLAVGSAFAQEGCAHNFDSSPNAITLGVITPFGQDGFGGEQIAWVVNPDKNGNSTDSVLQFTEAATGFDYAGFAIPFPRGNLAIPEGEPRTLSLQVWGPREAEIVIKVEPVGDPDAGTGDIYPIDATQSAPNRWRTLTYDIPEGADGSNLTVIPGRNSVPDSNTIWYVDNISYGNGNCGNTAAVRSPRSEVATLTASPNPARGATTLTLTEGTSRVNLFDALGRVALTEQLGFPASAAQRMRLGLSGLPAGSYLAVAQATSGIVLARARVVVE